MWIRIEMAPLDPDPDPIGNKNPDQDSENGVQN